MSITLTGISSSAAFGLQFVQSPLEQDLYLFGIASAEAVGSIVVTPITPLHPIHISSGEAFGLQVLVPGNTDILLTGVASSEAFGTQFITQPVDLTGIGSGEAFGTQYIGITLLGITSSEIIGSQTITREIIIYPMSIPSGEAVGTQEVSVDQSVLLTGIASTEFFGATYLGVSLQAIPSSETFGLSSLELNIALAGIVSREVIGLQNTSPVISLAGIDSSEAFGVEEVGLNVQLTGIPTDAQLGVPSLLGTVSILMTGIGSGESVGEQSLEASYVISLSGITSQEVFGGLLSQSNSWTVVSDGAVLVGNSNAAVSFVISDMAACSYSIRCPNYFPNLHFDCVRPRLYFPERRKFIPASLKGKAAVLPAITVCRQNPFLPVNSKE